MELGNNNEAAGNTHNGGGLKSIYELAKPALQLSADQQTKIEVILNKFREERQTIKNSGENNIDALRMARQQARQQMMYILNADQKKIWQENIAAWRQA